MRMSSLEELKSREREVDFLLGGTRFREDWDWLIEQAERVSKQETRINNLTFELAVSRVKNKRYREALKNIYELAEYDEYDNTLEQIVSEVEEALEGDLE